MRRQRRWLGWGLVVALLAYGCSSDDSTGQITDTGPDVTADGAADVGGDDAGVDSQAPDDTAGDDTEGQTDTEEDSAPTDDVQEVGEDLHHEVGEGRANIYPNNPIEDNQQTTEVTLANISDPWGYLTGPAVKVTNCLNEKCEGEPPDCPLYDLSYGGLSATVQLCLELQTVHAEADGNYLSIVPAADDDPDDSFAEVNMYYHVNHIRDYYKQVHGLETENEPVDAVVNTQVWVSLFSGWFGMENAAYIPKDSADELIAMLGIDYRRERDTLVFLQGDNEDMAYESDTIYHEYTHFMIGTTRLWSVAWDSQGLDNSPGSMNEAFADYFATSLTDSPLIGVYAMGRVGGTFGTEMDMHRDLSESKSCPEHLATEIHADGEIMSSALWEIRELLGQQDADSIILAALVTFDNSTNFTTAAQTIIAQAAGLTPPRDQEVQAIFESHGLINCERAKPFVDVDFTTTTGIPHAVEGTMSTGIPCFSSLAPGYHQFYFDVEADTKLVTVTYEASAGDFMGIPIPGMEQADLSIAFKKETPISWECKLGGAHNDADAVVEGAGSDSGFSVELFGACLQPGRYYMQFINHGQSPASLTKMAMTQTSSEPSGPSPCP